MNPWRLGLREVSVHFGTFDYALNCLVGPYKNVEKYVAWKFEDPGYRTDSPHEVKGRYFYRIGYAPIIWVPRKPRTPDEIGTLAHEVMHAIHYLLVDWAEIPFTADTQEVYCHAMGLAMRELLTKL